MNAGLIECRDIFFKPIKSVKGNRAQPRHQRCTLIELRYFRDEAGLTEQPGAFLAWAYTNMCRKATPVEFGSDLFDQAL